MTKNKVFSTILILLTSGVTNLESKKSWECFLVRIWSRVKNENYNELRTEQ